jgi:hypothetical protein
VLLGLGLYALRRISLGPVVAVETRDKFVPVATISPCEPEMHPHTPLEPEPEPTRAD